ncbi:MAG: HAD family phosphatase [Clostridiales bacterium]|nr:HAD family phosphatase [Clostridiales bacterium]
MIRNIVFDMGNVLVGYDPMRVCEHYITDEEDRMQVYTADFVSPEWVMLDMGVIEEEQALERICARLPERLHEAARLCMRDWDKYNMQTYAEMEPVVRGLKARGFDIYLCSNASNRLPGRYRELIPAVDCFSGILFSAPEKVMKPQRQIYECLFARYSLRPEECFFIDDAQINIDGARACGMDGYCYADADRERLKAVLDALPSPR